MAQFAYLKLCKSTKYITFIFSSSARVYGEENDVPYIETMKLGMPSSPYGASKVMAERVLADLALSDTNFTSTRDKKLGSTLKYI